MNNEIMPFAPCSTIEPHDDDNNHGKELSNWPMIGIALFERALR